MLTTSTFWNTFLRTPNEASAKGTGTDSFVQYPSTAQSLSDVCPRCTWAGIKQAKFTLYLRLQLGIFYWYARALHEAVLTTPLYHYRLPLAVSSTISVSEHEFMHRTEDSELSSRWRGPHSVFYYLQLKLAMNKEINELACYYNLRVECKKNPTKCTISNRLECTYCVWINSFLGLFYCEIKQFWKWNLKDPTNHSNVSNSLGNLQCMGK